MVAIVDDKAKRWIKIGPATAAGEGRGLMHNDVGASVDKTHRRAQARDPGADDMDHASAHRMP